jgi:hypothetical protein
MPCVTRGLGLSDSTRIRGFTTHDHDLKDPKILTSEVFYLPKGHIRHWPCFSLHVSQMNHDRLGDASFGMFMTLVFTSVARGVPSHRTLSDPFSRDRAAFPLSYRRSATEGKKNMHAIEGKPNARRDK